MKGSKLVNNKQKNKLAKNADFYRTIAKSKTVKTARNRIQQGGQFALAALLAPILSELAQHLLDKALPPK